jgi:cell division septation protein DedD
VPELSHDAADDGFHEIQLSGKQLVFLFMAATFVSVVIFLCGVFVGRGVRAARGEEPVDAAAAVQPSVPPQGAAADAGPPAAEPPAPPPETPDELSYHKRLQGQGAPAEDLKKPAPPQPAAVSPPPVAVATSAPVPADVPTTGRAGTQVVQVFATKDGSAAGSLVKRLIGKGYPAFLVPPSSGSGDLFYRVHVGRYADRREAEAIANRLKKEEQFNTFIISAR